MVNYLSGGTGARLGRPRRVSPREEARLRCQQAYLNARRIDPRNADYYANIYNDAPAAATVCESERAMMMFRYTTMLMEIAIDRVHWPYRVFGL